MTVIEESSIPIAVATITSEENMDTSDTEGSNFKVSPLLTVSRVSNLNPFHGFQIYLICDADQSIPTTSIGANEEVNMEP